MKSAIFALIAAVYAQDAYQEIGREVGSIYQRIGQLITASSYDHGEVLSVHGLAATAIYSLRHEISTLDWNAMIGSSAAVVYTSQLEDYIQGLATVNDYLTSVLTATALPQTQASSILNSVSAQTASASSAVSGAVSTNIKAIRISSGSLSASSSSGSGSSASSRTNSASSSASRLSSSSSSSTTTKASTSRSKSASSSKSSQTFTQNEAATSAMQAGIMCAAALAALF